MAADIQIIVFIKKTYKVFLVFMAAAAFFLFYNVYIVDRSIINLRIALTEAAEANTLEDFEKIRPLLKIIVLKEVTGKVVSNETIISMDVVQGASITARSLDQVEDIKVYLKTLVGEKEKLRGGLLSFLDRLNARIYAPQTELPSGELGAKAQRLLSKIGSLSDKAALQAAYFELGNIYVQSADIKKADEAFHNAVSVSPENAIAVRALFNLAWAYKSISRYDEAITHFEEILKDFPQDELAIAGEFQIADILYRKGDYEKARDEYAAIADRYPQLEMTKIALYQAGYISLYDLNDKEAAMKYFGRLKERFGTTEMAVHIDTHVKQIIARDFCEEGYKLLMAGRSDEAIRAFQKAIEISPDSSANYAGLGLGLYWLDKKNEALETVSKGVRLTIKDTRAVVNSIYVYIVSGKINDAIAIGERILAAGLIKHPRFYYNLGCAYLIKENPGRAIEMFNRAITADPEFHPAYNNLGYVLWGMKDYNGAIARFKQAVDISPNSVNPHFNLGVAYFYMNQLEDAYREFQTVLKLNPKHPKTNSYIANIEKALKYKPQA